MDKTVNAISVWLMVSLVSITGLAAASGQLQVLDAVKAGDHEAVESLLAEQDTDVNAPQAYGETALTWAATRDDSEMVELLMRAGADPNLANDYGITPLSMACTNGNAAMVAELLNAGANPNAAHATGETALMTCARTGNAEAVRLLLDQGAAVDAKESERSQTALMWAVAQGHSEAVKVLVEHGANVNATSATVSVHTPKIINETSGHLYDFYNENVYLPEVKGGFTPLMFAAQTGDVKSLRILLEARADVNGATRNDGSALVQASINGQEEAAVLLLENGADPNATDGYGLTALHWALQEGLTTLVSRPRASNDHLWVHPNMPDLVRALLAHGADPDARINQDFMPYEVTRFGRSLGNYLPQVGLTGSTPFLLAAAVADLTSMHALEEGGADPTLATEEGTTPLMVAAGLGPDRGFRSTPEQRKNFLEAVKLTVQWGNEVGVVGPEGRTALHGAALNTLTEVVRFLAENGADLEAKDVYGQTAMSLALGDPDGLVYQHLADYNADDKFRRRPGGPHKETVELLLKLGANPYISTGRDVEKF